MARTKETIFNAMMEARLAYSALASILTSLSKTSFYQSLFQLFAEFASDFEQGFDEHKSDVDDTFEQKQVGNTWWWQVKSLGFQLGDPLVRDSAGNLYYETIDEDLQIIERVSASTTVNGVVSIKVAKVDGGGQNAIPLESSELSAFTAYCNDITFAGISPSIISVNGDEVKIGFNVEIDPQLIDVTTGELFSDGSKPVEDAINDYIATFQTQDSFSAGGIFRANDLLADVLKASGVVNATFTLMTKQAQNESSFTNVLNLSGKQFQTFSGYVRIASGFVLSDNMTYTEA